jgi:hypothetical protein
MDGITIALNGTMYVGANDGSVYSVDGTDSPTAGTVHLLTSVTDGDGVGVAANPGDPSQPPFIAVNSNDGFMNEVALPSLAQSTIFSGGTRGDLVGVGPDGCLYATQSASIVRVEEADGTCPFQPTTVNTAPQVSISSPTFDQLIQVGTSGGTATVAVTAPLTDANTQGSHSCTIQWDAPLTPVAGTVTETVGSGSGTCSGSNNLYPGVYLIMVKVQNNRDALTGTASTEIVVYDPSAGFVTGGGWINSPSGAMPANPGPTGTANFGFVSAYKKGATVPTGETEFQFQVGNLDFHSNTYTVLVVSGNQAQYRGSGTINGANDSSGNPYQFILTAKDGDMNGGTNPDGFRMKITNSSGTVIYDNLVGATDDLGNTQILAGGDIKIHS